MDSLNFELKMINEKLTTVIKFLSWNHSPWRYHYNYPVVFYSSLIKFNHFC